MADDTWYDDWFDNNTSTSSSSSSDSGGILDWLKSAGSSALSLFKNDDGSINTGLLSLLGGGAAALLGGDSTVQRSGYQGGIPRYSAVREQVPATYDPDRRPGSGGQRYMSDVRYAPAGSDVDAARTAAAQEAAAYAAKNRANPARQVRKAAAGGLMSLPQVQGYYLGGSTDGMADKVPATIGGNQPAALSDGEFVIPADVVSHLGNGNSNAGADQLYAMMDRIRQARTGNKKQGKQINPKQMMPS